MEKREFVSFADFYPYYISQHSKKATRMMHFAGSSTGLVIAVNAVTRGPRWSIVIAPVVGYGAAWASHFWIEKNKPASWGYTWYSFKADWKMLADIARGRDSDLQDMADRVLAEEAATASTT